MALDIDTLAADYLVRNLVDARLTRVVPVPQPAVGADWDVAVPGGVYWDIQSVFQVFVSSAAVANRVPAIELTDGSTTLGRVATSVTVTAGLTTRQYWVKFQSSVVQGVSGFSTLLPLPPTLLSGGWHIRSLTSAIDVGDQYSGVVLVVRELAADRIGEVIRKSQQDAIGLLGEPTSDDYQL